EPSREGAQDGVTRLVQRQAVLILRRGSRDRAVLRVSGHFFVPGTLRRRNQLPPRSREDHAKLRQGSLSPKSFAQPSRSLRGFAPSRLRGFAVDFAFQKLPSS